MIYRAATGAARIRLPRNDGTDLLEASTWRLPPRRPSTQPAPRPPSRAPRPTRNRADPRRETDGEEAEGARADGRVHRRHSVFLHGRRRADGERRRHLRRAREAEQNGEKSGDEADEVRARAAARRRRRGRRRVASGRRRDRLLRQAARPQSPPVRSRAPPAPRRPRRPSTAGTRPRVYRSTSTSTWACSRRTAARPSAPSTASAVFNYERGGGGVSKVAGPAASPGSFVVLLLLLVDTKADKVGEKADKKEHRWLFKFSSP